MIADDRPGSDARMAALMRWQLVLEEVTAAVERPAPAPTPRTISRPPEMSGGRFLDDRQRGILLAIAGTWILTLVVNPVIAIIMFNALITVIYVAVLLYNVVWFRHSLDAPEILRVSDSEAKTIPDDELPKYTVLVCAYREENVIADTVLMLELLDYPKEKLEIKLLLESDDFATILAAKKACAGKHIEITRVPAGEPRTKPKALNCGWRTSSGELVTVFDVEDLPDPLQLRRAAFAFQRQDPTVACLQARLHYHNASQNIITSWFAAEYATWFSTMLPALIKLQSPIPLGGTSMHLRASALRTVGGWDPYNVTEDADLGIRLHRHGFRTLILDSVTFEEANSDFVNWVKQRSRWYKGYLQTWLVHMRRPLDTWRQLGALGFVGFCVVLGATPLLALLNPFCWLLVFLWFVGRFTQIEVVFPGWIFYPAMLSMFLGNFLAIYRNVVAMRTGGRPQLIPALMLYPIYWLMMSVAAVRAITQLVIAPSFWDKTVHGLDRRRAPVSSV